MQVRIGGTYSDYHQREIRNFKSLSDVDLPELSDLVVFIGKNSSGKSNLLDALGLMFLNFGTELEKQIGVLEYLFPDHKLQRVQLAGDFGRSIPYSLRSGSTFFPNDQVDGEGFEEVELDLAKRIVTNQTGIAVPELRKFEWES